MVIAAGLEGGWGGSPKKVLVCDDERHIARLIQVNLERFGHSVTCAFDGREAIEKLEHGDFRHALIDVMMPYLDGFEVLKWIRTHRHTEKMWVGMMSAKMIDPEIETKMAYRADRYILKPFNPASAGW